jgi:hypothetical protein
MLNKKEKTMKATAQNIDPVTSEIPQKVLASRVLLEREIREKAKLLKKMDEVIFDALKKGLPVEYGVHEATIKVVEGKRTVSWKDVVTRLKGEGYVNNVISHTKKNPDKEKLEVR